MELMRGKTAQAAGRPKPKAIRSRYVVTGNTLAGFLIAMRLSMGTVVMRAGGRKYTGHWRRARLMVVSRTPCLAATDDFVSQMQ